MGSSDKQPGVTHLPARLAMRSTPINFSWTLAIALSLAACGGGTPTGSSPTATTAPPTVTVSIRVFDASRGEIAAARSSQTGTAGSSFQVRLTDLAVAGVDTRRAVLREDAANIVGTFVSFTATGTLDVAFPSSNKGYALFLFSTADAVDYECLDKGDSSQGGVYRRFATLRMARPGESLLGITTVVGPDDLPFQLVAATYNQALNPFGVAYGRIDFVGQAASADMVGGWAPYPNPVSNGGYGGNGRFWIVLPTNAAITYYPNSSWAIAVHELAHAYLGAPDYYVEPCGHGSLDTILIGGRLGSLGLATGAENALRYWALRKP